MTNVTYPYCVLLKKLLSECGFLASYPHQWLWSPI